MTDQKPADAPDWRHVMAREDAHRAHDLATDEHATRRELDHGWSPTCPARRRPAPRRNGRRPAFHLAKPKLLATKPVQRRFGVGVSRALESTPRFRLALGGPDVPKSTFRAALLILAYSASLKFSWTRHRVFRFSCRSSLR